MKKEINNIGQFNFNDVIIVGPSPKRKGGIATIIGKYKDCFSMDVFASTNHESTLLSFVFLPERLIRFVFFLFGNKSYKIVHIHCSSEGSFVRKYFFFLIAKIFRKKTIIHIHSGRFLNFYNNSNVLYRVTIKWVLTSCDILVVLSESWVNKYKQIFNAKRIEVIPNIIQEPKKEVNSVSIEKDNLLHVVFLGKLFKPKGIYDLLETVFEHYNYFKSKMVLHIAGYDEDGLEHKFRPLDQEGVLRFEGFLNLKKKNILLNNSDLLILPSYSEGFPVSLLEAMSHKLAVIATEVGGIPDLVSHNKNGLLIQPGDKDGIFKALEKYIENPNLAQEHGKVGYNTSRRFMPSNVAQIIRDKYNSI